MNKYFLFFFAAYIFVICKQENKKDTINTKLSAKPEITTVKKDSVYTFHESWADENSVPHKWILLNRDNNGYLVYKPCDGSNPRIYFNKDSLTVYWQLDAPSLYKINSFTMIKENKAFRIKGSNEYEKIELDAEIKDAGRKLVLFTFGDFKWVMTPLEFSPDFRQVDNPCETEMKPEKQFLPVEF